ncbi:PREDICTED: SCAN domain-containing protein 1-like [Elephantulus edwardii]|uniref:SCAN domain-containing protein 1-like n=1 Tax=Elephantulus edwardii TaxID=28737 RepID=UPI0003F0B1C5|nr:PREDICTED: SCAN domain-containing protein 1-like [Elephantulus edwardii]
MAATESSAASGSIALPPEEQGGAGPSPDPERNSGGSFSIPEASPPVPELSSPNGAVPQAIPALPVAASASLGSLPAADADPRSRPGPETFRQRFRQFRYQDAAGPREAFRQLRELSRQWLRPDVRTKEQIIEMLVQEQLLAILPEAARARRRGRRTDVRITG